MRGRALILALWLALVVAGLLAASRLEGRLDAEGSPPPGSESARAAELLRRRVPALAGPVHLAVVQGDAGRYSARLARRLGGLVLDWPGTKVRAVLVAGRRDVSVLRTQIAQTRPPPGVTVALTGPAEAVADLYAYLGDRLAVIERISLLAALIVLVLVLRNLPLTLIGLSVGVTCLLATPAAIYLISYFKPVGSLNLVVAAVVALAMGLDYPLLFLSRWAESRDVRETLRTAGKTIATTAAILVGAGLSILLVPIPALHSVGLTLAAAAILAAAATLTLLPALVGLLPKREARSRPAGTWNALSALVLARPRTSLALALAAVGALAAPIAGLKTWSPSYAVLPPGLEAARAIRALEAAGVAGAAGPIVVALDLPAQRQADRVAGALVADPRIGRVWRVGAGLLVVESRKAPDHPDNAALVGSIRGIVGTAGAVGGAAATQADVERAMRSALPAVVGANLLLILLILGLHLRSVVLPLKAVLTNLLPVLAGLGAVVAVCGRDGGYVQSLTVLIMGSLLLAISMDYEIFILSRIREEYDAGGDHSQAIAAGMRHSGRVVVGAALVLLSVFVPYGFVDAPGLRELGVGLSVAILVDATLVRLVLVPAALALLADWNWWHPFKR